MTVQLIKSCKEAIPKATVTKVLSIVQWGIPEDIAKEVLSVDSIKGAIKLQLLKEINGQCQSLFVRTRGEPSVLKDTSVEALESVEWCNVMKEMKNRAPDILDFIATVAAPRLKKNVDAQVPPVCMGYAMMMNQRWQELSLVRKIATIILGVGHSSKKVILTRGGSKIFRQKGPKKLCQSASPPPSLGCLEERCLSF